MRNTQPEGGDSGEGISPSSGVRAARARRGIGNRHGLEQRAGVGMAEAPKSRVRVGDLHDTAEIEHQHAVAGEAYRRQVVRDEHQRQLHLLLQILQQVGDLRFDRRVERGERLIADQQRRARRTSARAMRCAAPGRPRTRAAGGAGGRSTARPPRIIARTRSRRSAAVSCGSKTRSGSATVSPMLMRGSSEPSGSWNISCRCRRSARSQRASRADAADRAVERACVPLSAGTSRSSARAMRRLAAAGLTDDAESLAACEQEADAVDGSQPHVAAAFARHGNSRADRAPVMRRRS